jgi:nucleoside-diphosphate-sugar epimerase
MHWTIIGAGGFIGSRLVDHLRKSGHDVVTADRSFVFEKRKPLGHVVYATGLTSDFRSKPFETVEAHVIYLHDILRYSSFTSFLYLSSTRLYANSATTEEEGKISLSPLNCSDLYNASKLMGESLCLNSGLDGVRVARLSNIVGEKVATNNFLDSLVKDAVGKKTLSLQSSLNSEKDFLFIGDLLNLIELVSTEGQSRIYNLASGTNTKTKQIVDIISRETNCAVEVCDNPPLLYFPRINIDRISLEFKFRATQFEQFFLSMLNNEIINCH